MDDDEKDGVKRADRSKKPMNDVLQRVARPAWRSPLFFWLVEHHDTLRRNEAETGRGVPWRELCVEFVELGITLADGRPVKPATAKRNWHRVRRELARVEERRARERAERERRFATDPRRNMPSRFPKGDYGPPLSDRLPQRAPWPHARPTSASPPKAGTDGIADGGAEGRGLAVRPGGPVLTGGFEESRPAEEFTVVFEGQPLDLRLFIRPGEDRYWELPGADEDGWARVLKQELLMRFDSWRNGRVGDPHNRVDVEWRKRLGKP